MPTPARCETNRERGEDSSDQVPEHGREIVVERLATASGALGSAAEYLYQTRDGLRAHGIPDPELERLAASVEAAQALAGGG